MEKMLICGARDSPLSRAQFAELQRELPEEKLVPVFVKTVGDLRKEVSLRTLGKSDFFTRELDQMLLSEQIRIAVHSAKDLPEPLPKGLSLVALTAGVDPRDALVVRQDEDLSSVKVVATSSESREARVRQLLPNSRFIDLRGTIYERLQILDRNEVDGVVVAEAALVRLGLRHLNRYFLPPPTTEGQGRLAIIARSDDWEMFELFLPLNKRESRKTICFGLGDASCFYHYPVIRTVPIAGAAERILSLWDQSTHILFTSKRAVFHLPPSLNWEGKEVFAIGEATASLIPVQCRIAKESNQEGMVELLKSVNAPFLWPRSSRSRSLLADSIKNLKIVDLYDTVSHRPGFPPSLDDVEEILFTSPSCVEGFCAIYGTSLPKVKIRVQGAVTADACRKFFGEHTLASFTRSEI
jgi:hydroxymethylbilane synthase